MNKYFEVTGIRSGVTVVYTEQEAHETFGKEEFAEMVAGQSQVFVVVKR